MSEIKKLYQQIDLNNLPSHIAIIMDGNGRWAKQRNLPRIKGYEKGVTSVREIIKACLDLKINILTLYAFSMENWQRPQKEVSYLMKLLYKYLKKNKAELCKNDIKLTAIGNLKFLPKLIYQELTKTINLTKNNKTGILNLALSYSGREEIINAVKKLCVDVSSGLIKTEEIDEMFFSKYLYTNGLPDPDLLIRTSGEMRISNFLLWQMAYTEIYITPIYWPDFRKKEFYKAIIEYQKRKRRFGKI